MMRSSIKKRITLWYAIFMVLIAVILLGILSLYQNLLSNDFYGDMLEAALNHAYEDLLTGADFQLSSTRLESGVHLSILDESGELVQGTTTFSASPKESTLRVRIRKQENWYIKDRYVPIDEQHGVWLRAYISASLAQKNERSLISFMLLLIPLLLLAVLYGGYRLTKYAFQPIDELIAMADSISNSRDLHRRTRIDGQSDEVGRLARTFDNMLERLERSMDREKHFISDASHELRTPLSVICSQSEYALMPGRTMDEKDAALQVILDRSRKTSDMLSQMLMLSRLDYDQLPLSMEKIDLSELIESMVLEMQIHAARKDISIIQQLQPRLILECDELLVMRMLNNLLQNAIQYGRQGGHIWVRAEGSGNIISIVIQDDGIGIAAEEQDKIWRRFYQSDKTHRAAKGAGLGLPIVRWIAETHGGKIHLSSAPGTGSTFTIALPVQHTPN